MRKKILEITIAYIGVLACTFCEISLCRGILMSLDMPERPISILLAYWLIALVPLFFYGRKIHSFAELGFTKRNLSVQIFIGMILALVMSFILTLLPHLLGLGEAVDNGRRYVHLWQYLYEFAYGIFSVGAVEEIVFRGYFYNRFKDTFHREWIAVLGSSLLFGFAHIFQGNIIQAVMIAFLGLVFCIFRLKIKNCAILSLIIAHGMYDALISVWASLLLS